MKPKPDASWESLLDRELKRLPDQTAPTTLVPRVMAAVQNRARLPWWRRTWWTWPPAAKLFSLVLWLTLCGAAYYLSLTDWGAAPAGAIGHKLSQWLEPITAFASCAFSLVNALLLALRKAGQWVLPAMGLICLASYLSCVGLGTLFYRVAFNR